MGVIDGYWGADSTLKPIGVVDTRPCSGLGKVWYCESKYPESWHTHRIPRTEFTPQPERDGGMCKICRFEEGKRDTFRKYAAGGPTAAKRMRKEDPALWNSIMEICDRRGYDGTPVRLLGDNDISGQREIDLKPVDNAGDLYVMKILYVQNVRKVGKTYTDGAEARMRESLTFSALEIEHTEWSPDVLNFETAVHTILRDKGLALRGTKDFGENVGTEQFGCSLEVIMEAIASCRDRFGAVAA